MRARYWLIASTMILASCDSSPELEEPVLINDASSATAADAGSTATSDAGTDAGGQSSQTDSGSTPTPDAGTSSTMDASVTQDAAVSDASAAADAAQDAAASGDAAGDAGAGAAAIASLGAACSMALEKACTGHNAADKLVCLDGKWTHNGSCDVDSRCETARGASQGLCVTVATGCAGKAPGATVCDGLTVKTCGPDLTELKLTTSCSANAHCDESGGPSCKCDTGYAANASGACTNANDCADNPCGTGNQCMDALSDYTCTCNATNYWQRDPKTCVSKFERVVSGGNRTCAIRRDRTVACWGEAMDGNNTVPQQIAGLTNVTQLSVGVDHACALREGGGVVCWGENDFGQLGTGNNTDSLRTPVSPVSLNNVWQVSAGDGFTCAVTLTDRVYCWGSNSSGQLGINSTQASVNRPTQITGSNTAFDLVATGSGHACARRTNDTVSCWGSNNHGQLGTGAASERMNAPVAVASVSGGFSNSNVSEIAVGAGFSCVRKTGTVHCWGAALGVTDGADVLAPAQVGDLTDAAQISAGAAGTHVCARKTTGNAIACWGSDANGQLGNGDGSSSATAVAISGSVTSFRDLSAGVRHTCAVRNSNDNSNDRDILCWGEGSAGELGNGMRDDHQTQVTVVR